MQNDHRLANAAKQKHEHSVINVQFKSVVPNSLENITNTGTGVVRVKKNVTSPDLEFPRQSVFAHDITELHN